MALRSTDLPARKLPRRYLIILLVVLDLLAVGFVAIRLAGNPSRTTPADRPAAGRAQAGRSAAARVFFPIAAAGQGRARQAPIPTPRVPAALAVQPPAGPTGALQAKIEIVWPHGNAPLRNADLANITVYLLRDSGARSVPCAADYTVRLWQALNTAPARPIAVGQKRMFTAGGHAFPVWDFNDIDVSAARDPANRLLFFATVDGVATRHNVWIHAADARTVFPQSDVPPGTTAARPAMVDARIEILWPHDDLPPERARQANITAYLFDAETGRALASDSAWRPQVRLHWTLNNDADRGSASSLLGQQRVVNGPNGLQFLAWDFNDVDVSQALDSLNKIHFWLSVDGGPALTNIWTHGAAPPTLFPQADLPPSCQ